MNKKHSPGMTEPTLPALQNLSTYPRANKNYRALKSEITRLANDAFTMGLVVTGRELMNCAEKLRQRLALADGDEGDNI